MTCPFCGKDLPVDPIVNKLVICPICLRSVVIDGDTARLATGADTTGLNDPDLAKLRKARAAARKAQS